MVIVDHFIWFFYFARVTEDARHTNHRMYKPKPTENLPGFTEIATFFGICVWLAPLFLFLSLSANDNALPMSASMLCSVSVSLKSVLTPLFFSGCQRDGQPNGILDDSQPFPRLTLQITL